MVKDEIRAPFKKYLKLFKIKQLPTTFSVKTEDKPCDILNKVRLKLKHYEMNYRNGGRSDSAAVAAGPC